MSLPTLNGTARLLAPPELRFSAQGTAVVLVRLAFNSRKKDPVTNEWIDADSLFIDGKVFGQHAQNLADSLDKGMEVVVVGRPKTESWEKDGEKKSKTVLLIDSIGPSLWYATARVEKAGGGSGSGRQDARQAARQGASSPPAEDPWASSAGGGQAGAWGDDSPPF
jgi:single-strand DNA-binding protein